MTGRTHDLAAVTGLLVAAVVVAPVGMSLSTMLIALVANLIGGITPDIDEPTAPLWRNLPIGGSIGKVVDKLLGGHRFITHSLIGLALFGGLAYLLLRFLHPIMPHTNVTIVWWAFMIGFASHLVIDTFTKEGVPWLLPIPYKFGLPPIKAWRVTTGELVEKLIIFPGFVLFDIYFCWAHYAQLLQLLPKH